MISELYEKVNYISGLNYIFSSFIYEYDMAKANISVLYSKGAISEDLYKKLMVASREERQTTIGLLELEDRRITKIKANGIKEAKKKFFEMNQLEDQDILSIKNDAIFVINKNASFTKINDYIEFKLKNCFTSFIKLKNIEIYYGFNRINQTESVSIKGLGKNEYLHKDFLSDFIIYIINTLECGDIEDAISSYMSFYDDYINRRLNIGYYREYNAQSFYTIVGQPYGLTAIENSEYNKSIINIRYNMDILRDLYSYICEKYFYIKKF